MTEQTAHPVAFQDGQPNQPSKSKRATQERRAKRAARRAAAVHPVIADDRVLTLDETAIAADISLATLRREIKRGTGPRVTKLSERRRGITGHDFRAWRESRSA